MTEALVSGILVQLAKLAIDETKENVKLLTNVKKEVQKITLNLRAIKVVLEDAEEKEFGDKPLQLWLELLKEVAFRIEDVLDDCKVARLTLRSRDKDNGAFKAKVLSCISLCIQPSQGVGRYEIASRIREINTSLDEIAKQKNDYGLAAKPERKQPRRIESTSFGVVLNLHGRDEIREDIIKCLLSELDEEGGGVKTISVLGMGGVGKTALAQRIYHDGRIKARFGRNSIWVCVSDYFDLRNVAMAIIEGLEHQMIPAASYQSQLQQLLERISSSVQGKKFFLVLDDVWEQDIEKWRDLIQALKHGAPGSRVILTTRKEEVARMLKYSQVFPLEKLSDDHCWMIFSQFAFDGRDERERRELEDIGKAISNRCKGLPLAAITLGKLLRYKNGKEEWESILNSEIWKLNVAEQEIFTPLLLSYYDLPSPIRRCFRFCVLKLKDSNYLKDDVINEWASQGYLELDGNANLELTGEEYLNFLASRSFFQDVETLRGAIRGFKIHDIVHDFGQYLSKDEIVMKEVNQNENLIIDLSSRIRHLSLSSAKNTSSPTSVIGAEKLHTVRATGWINETSLCNIFNQAKHLRMICLDCGSDLADLSIPEEIGNLIHLNHLSFSNLSFETLPESMSKLCNLQYLKIRYNLSLKRLPYWIEKLVGLRFLGTLIGGGIGVQYPKSVARLTNLRVLIGINLSADGDDPNEFTLGDLEKLVQLRRLWIVLDGIVIDAGEVVRAKFVNKTHLNDFKIFLGTGMKGRKDYVKQALNLPSHINLRFSNSLFFGEFK